MTPTALPLLDAVVLVGGRGTRLASVVKDVPKPLAAIAGRPFLDHLLLLVAKARSVRRIILGAGHLGHEIERYANGLALGVEVKAVIEEEPLGTAGAIRNALPMVEGERLLVLNGDAISDWPIDELVRFHVRGTVPVSLIALGVPDVERYGQLQIRDGRVERFDEKGAAAGVGMINGGVYCLDRSIVESWPPGPLSIERDVLPHLASQGNLACISHQGPFIDIGTPESYRHAQVLARNISGL